MKKKLNLPSILLALLLVSGFCFYFFLPKPPLLKGLAYSTAVYDKQGHLLRLSLNNQDKYRLFTPLKQISPLLIQATLLQEDRYFYHHPGVNPVALGRALWQTYVLRHRRVGASTISMQVARLRYHLYSKSLGGKLKQILLALELERHYSKAEILEAYLNLAPYGQNIEGIGAASLIYFHKPAGRLNLSEALTLALMPQNPGKRSATQPEFQKYRLQLFKRWAAQHPQDQKQESLIKMPLQLHQVKELPFTAPHYVNSLLTETLASGSLAAQLDGRLQALVERLSNQYILQSQRLGVDNLAILLVDTNDLSIVAAKGSADFFNQGIAGQINGLEAKRSPGSTLKPFIYGLALDQGLIHPATVLKDVPQQFGAYSPDNFDYHYAGPLTAEEALIYSRNIPAVDLANQLTNPSLHQLLVEAEVSQLKPASDYGLALALGAAELSMRELIGLYAMLANEGYWRPVVYQQQALQGRGKRLLSREAAFLVLDMLSHSPQPSQAAPLPFPVAWKTGTSSGYRDAWAVGVFSHYALAVWLGNFNNQSNQALVGRDLAAPLFFRLIAAINQENGPLPPLNIQPEGMNLRQIEVCKASGLLPTRYCLIRRKTWFIPGKSPIKTDTIFREVAIDGKTGLRACQFDEATRFAVYEFWPSDLGRLFKQAGIQRKTPPAYAPGCQPLSQSGLSPQISSPNRDLTYILNLRKAASTTIPLSAIADGDVQTLYWFVNNTFLGKSPRDQSLIWKASPGSYLIRVVDDHGLSDAREIRVSMH